jgi:hypothetical protein
MLIVDARNLAHGMVSESTGRPEIFRPEIFRPEIFRRGNHVNPYNSTFADRAAKAADATGRSVPTMHHGQGYLDARSDRNVTAP